MLEEKLEENMRMELQLLNKLTNKIISVVLKDVRKNNTSPASAVMAMSWALGEIIGRAAKDVSWLEKTIAMVAIMSFQRGLATQNGDYSGRSIEPDSATLEKLAAAILGIDVITADVKKAMFAN